MEPLEAYRSHLAVCTFRTMSKEIRLVRQRHYSVQVCGIFLRLHVRRGDVIAVLRALLPGSLMGNAQSPWSIIIEQCKDALPMRSRGLGVLLTYGPRGSNLFNLRERTSLYDLLV